MAQYDFQVADYERIFRKRYKLVLLTVIISLVSSIIFGNMRTPLFRATATVKVDRSSVMGFGMEQVMYGTWDNVETQARVLTSFPVLLKAAKRLNLVPDTVSEENLLSNNKVLAILEDLRSKLSATQSSGTNIIQIMVTSSDPDEAQRLANAAAFAYKDFSVSEKRLHATKTKSFIEEQLDRCRADLSTAEHDVRSFEESQRIPSMDVSSRSTIEEAAKVQGELDLLDEELVVIAAQQKKLKARRDRGYDGNRIDLASAETDSMSTQGHMSWVSSLTDKDPGLGQLNNRLIMLQIQLDDQQAYYKGNHPGIRDIEKRVIETIDQILNEYGKKIEALNARKAKLMASKATVDVQLQKIPASEMEYARLVRRMKVNDELYTMLTKKLQEAMIAEAGVVDDVTIMAMASLPRTPTNKSVPRVAVIGLFLGLILGVIIAVIREMFDTSIGTIEDVERTLKINVLAVIPHIQTDDQPSKHQSRSSKDEQTHAEFRARLVTQFDPKKPTAEAYRILRTSLDYLSYQHPIKTLLVTSATMQEGKSTTISNLAVVFAQQGKKILLMGCNLRRPSLYRIFGVDKGPGIADILIGKAVWQDCVRTVTDLALGEFSMEEILHIPGLENFHLITFGHTPPNPAELLSSSRMNDLLNEVKNHFDIILVDGPPLLPVADSIVLSTKVDAVLLVHKVGSAPRNSLTLSKERLTTVQARLLGVVLNDIRPETSGITYSYVYSRYYGAKESQKKSPKSRQIKSKS